MIKVLIVEDQAIIGEGIKSLIEQENEIKVVGIARNGNEALQLCNELLPDLVLMDLVMPVCDGVEGTRLIKANHNSIKVIILTTFNDDENIFKALNNGADGYLLKDIKPDELIMTIKSAALGLSVMYKQAFSSMVRQINSSNKTSIISKSQVDVDLTERELSIVHMIVDGKDNKEIADNLYLTEGSVRNIISGILKRLNLRDRIQLAVFAVKNDLI